MKKTILLFSLLYAGICFGQHDLKTLNNPYFKGLFTIRANEEFIDVNTGHSAPYIYDYNRDGVDDLLVGEFGKEFCPGVDTLRPHAYIQGRCRIYINHGTNRHPIYKNFQWLMADGKPAYVPITCCISFVPRFVDINGDGTDDVLSGSYPGEIYLFNGLGNNRYAAPQILTDLEGDTLRPAHSMAVDPIDWDNDGDIDLLVSSRGNGVYLIRNIGTKSAYKFTKPEPITLKRYQYVYNLMNQKRSDIPTYLNPRDFDNDGLFDLIGGSEWGDLAFYKNIGTPGKPEFGEPITLWDNQDGIYEEGKVDALCARVKTWVYDYDGDGKADILAGDICSTQIKTRELSPKEEMRKNELERQHRQLLRSLYMDRNWEQLKKQGKLNKEESKQYQQLQKQYKSVQKKIEKLNNYTEGKDHGFVWVFLRK